MSRWEPGAPQRLQAAALTLFQQRGYDNVTVAEIAKAAGLTRRSFFNHFADKREIFSGGADAFRAAVADYLRDVDPGCGPFDAAVIALTRAGIGIGEYREHAVAVRSVVESTGELRERHLAKMADVTDVLSEGLQARGEDPVSARLTASLAVVAYETAWQAWAEHPDKDFGALMGETIARLRDALTTAGNVRRRKRSARPVSPLDG